MNRQDYQQALPDGFRLGDELTAAGHQFFGRAFEVSDARLHNGFPVKRVVRFFNGVGVAQNEISGVNWRTPFEERLRQLVSLNLPHVLTPREVGALPDGTTYLLGEHDGTPLSSAIPAAQGIGLSDAERFVREILTGLAALHARKLPHGDLRPGTLLLEENGAERTVWIADAAVGPITWWTKGEVQHSEALRYAPPEWKKRTQAPSPQADLYALGLTACEMFLGKKGLEGLKNGDGSIWQQLWPKLKHVGVPQPTLRLLRELLDPDPQKRPADAGAALKRWNKLERRKHLPLFIGAGVAVVGALMLGWFGWQSMSDLEQQVVRQEEQLSQRDEKLKSLETEKDKLKIRMDTALRSNETLTAKNAELTAENAELREQMGKPDPTPPDSPPNIAREIWTRKLRSDEQLVAELDGLLDTFRREKLKADGRLSDPAVLDDVHSFGTAWWRQLRQQYMESREWFAIDPETKRLYRATAQAPWDGQRLHGLKERLQALTGAEKKWREWADDDKKAWADIDKLIDSRKAKDAVYSILGDWRDAIIEHKSKAWSLRLKRGAAPPKYGVTRVITVYSGDRDGVAFGPHNWSSATSHQYRSTDQLKFQWVPGETIRIILEGEFGLGTGFVARPNLIDESFKGPLAIWRLHDKGNVKAGSFKLEFEVEDCPGPPRRQSLEETAKKALTVQQK